MKGLNLKSLVFIIHDIEEGNMKHVPQNHFRLLKSNYIHCMIYNICGCKAQQHPSL